MNDDSSILILTESYCRLDLAALKKQYGLALDAPVELDMGCGIGSFSAKLAKAFPDRLILAADVMIGRLRKLARRCERENLRNIVILRVEARNLCEYMLPDGSISRFHLLCPDPWPKDRHRGHRLLCSDFVSQIRRVVGENGVFHYSSDDEAYRDTVRRVVGLSRLFTLEPESIADTAALKSTFEERWLAQGKAVLHFGFRAAPILLSPGH